MTNDERAPSCEFLHAHGELIERVRDVGVADLLAIAYHIIFYHN